MRFHMGEKNITGVRRVIRGGKPRLVIDFRYTNREGVRARFKRDASVQGISAAQAEAKRLMVRAAETGEVEPEPDPNETSSLSVTFEEFVAGPLESLFMPSYRPATAVRYRGLLRQSVSGLTRSTSVTSASTRRRSNGVATRPSRTSLS
jgi:hypothetical protein